MYVAYIKLVEEVRRNSCIDALGELVEGGDECDEEDWERGPRTPAPPAFSATCMHFVMRFKGGGIGSRGAQFVGFCRGTPGDLARPVVGEYASAQEGRGNRFEHWNVAVVRVSARLGVEIYTMDELRRVIDVAMARRYADGTKGRGKLITRGL